MITAQLLSTYSSPAAEILNISEKRALSRLIAAAVINQRFCELLLMDAEAAICHGYCGEDFGLSDRARALVFSIQATSLEEFASALDQTSDPPPLPTGPLSFGRITKSAFSAAEGLVFP